MMIVDRGLIDCAIIKVETDVRTDDYNKINNTLNHGYTYTIRLENVENFTRFIQETFKEFGLPCLRVYPTGFANVPEKYIWTKQRIVEQVKSEAQRLGIKQQSVSVATR